MLSTIVFQFKYDIIAVFDIKLLNINENIIFIHKNRIINESNINIERKISEHFVDISIVIEYKL